MFNPVGLVARAFASHLARGYREVYGRFEPDYTPTLRAIARLAVERIGDSDALYHDYRHTVLVTMVGQAILHGRLMVETVTPDDWLHFTVATLLHDIGYLRGACRGDGEGRCVIDAAGTVIDLPRGASDAFLAPWHIERGKLFVRQRCALTPGLDVERICRGIELTRFPVPEDNDHAETETEAGLVRAADLIGQLADPGHAQKFGALFHEFVEIGKAERLGYTNPADVAAQYPKFFWNAVEPYIGAALGHLERTVDGRLWTAQLYAHVFVEEHRRSRGGPERGS